MNVIISASNTNENYMKLVGIIKTNNIEITKILCPFGEDIPSLAKRYNKEHNLPIEYYPIDWYDVSGKPDEEIVKLTSNSYWKNAYIYRNNILIKEADILIVIWNGKTENYEQLKTAAINNNLIIYENIYKL